LDKELELVKNTKNSKVNVLLEDFQEEKEMKKVEEILCNGYTTLDSKEKCLEKGLYLYLDQNAGKQKVFCKTPIFFVILLSIIIYMENPELRKPNRLNLV
jgi:hypothetical protein